MEIISASQKNISEKKKCFEIFGRSTPCPNCKLKKIFIEKKPQFFNFQPLPGLPNFLIELFPCFDKNGEIISIFEKISIDEKKIKNFEESEKKNISEILIEKQILVDFLKKNAAKNKYFLRLATHQMQYPIGILRKYIDLFCFEPNKKNKKVLINEIEYLANLTRNLLRLAHAESGMKIDFARVEIAKFVKKIFEEFRDKEDDFKFFFAAEKKILIAKIDPFEFGEVLRIILGNAIKFSPQNGKIKIKIGAENGKIKIEISDEGCGIAPENLEKIFEPFFHGQIKKSGAGLGLSLAKKIVQLHGGRIFAESEKNKKTKFVIEIPQILPRKQK